MRCVVVALFAATCILVQPPTPATGAPATQPSPSTQPRRPLIRSTSADAPLVSLISYVSERLEINFIYDDSVARQPINLRTPAPVRQSQLLDVLSNVP